MSDRLKIVVDRELCSGHARCVELMPEVFQLDDEGFSVPDNDVPITDRAALDRVVALCPELAISYTEE